MSASVAFILWSSLLVSFSGPSQANYFCNCHMNELDKCSLPILEVYRRILENSVADPGTEFDLICDRLGKSRICREDYYLRCASATVRGAIKKMMFQEVDEASEFFCQNQRAEYVKNAPCLHESKPDTRNCGSLMRPELFAEQNKTKQLVGSCCMMTKMTDCTNDVVRAKCGNEAAEVMKKMSAAVGSEAAMKSCKALSLTARQCEETDKQSPPAPQGSKSSQNP